MIFLGTGAAELMPNPFCGCEFCTALRAAGERPRKRSATLLDSHTLMDFGPDALGAAQTYNLSLADLENVFITHTHEDHLSFTNLEVLTMTPYRDTKPLHVWLSPRGLEYIRAWMAGMRLARSGGTSGLEALERQGKVVFHAVTPYSKFTVGSRRVYAVETNHRGCGKDEFSFNYVLREPNGSQLLYALDTGLYSKKNLEALAGRKIGTVITEGTFGSLHQEPSSSHMCCETLVVQMENFLAHEVISKDATFYITHINQCNRFDHAHYQAWMDEHAPVRTVIAYDGMTL